MAAAKKTKKRTQARTKTPARAAAKAASFTLAQIVEKFGGELLGAADAPRVRISRIAPPNAARAGDIAFVSNSKYLPQLATSRASAVILGKDARDATTLPRIVSDNPYAYFAKVSALLNPITPAKAGVHCTAVIDRTAKIAKSASIAAHVVIGARAKIGAGAIIGAGSVIGDDVEIGADTRLSPNVTVYHRCTIGERGIVHAGAVIGADGFGIANEKGRWLHIPQIGRVVIGDDVEIGANTTIDRGALDDTVIEEGVKLDNQIQIAHNVRIGAHTAIAACTGIAGSTKIGKHCIIGGGVSITGHATIVDGVSISGGTSVIGSIHQAGTYGGPYPHVEQERWVKNAAQLRRLEKLVERVKHIEHALALKKGEPEEK